MIIYYFSNSATNIADIVGSSYFTDSAVNSGSISIGNLQQLIFYPGTINYGTISVDGNSTYGAYFSGGSNYGTVTSPLTSTAVYFTLSALNVGVVSAWSAAFYQATNNGTLVGAGEFVFNNATNNGTVSGFASMHSGSVNTGTILSAYIAGDSINTGTIGGGGGGVQFTALSTMSTVYYVSGANMTLDAAASASAVLYTDEALSTPVQVGTTFYNPAGTVWYVVNSGSVVARFNGAGGGLYYINGVATNLDGGGNNAVYDNNPQNGGFSYQTNVDGLFYQGGVPYTGAIAATAWTAQTDVYGNTIGFEATGAYNVNFVAGVLTP
jgi:hypothetical protein